MKKVFIIGVVIFVFIGMTLLYLSANKTFFKTTYIGVRDQEFFIPKYSFFKEECCMTAATFYSLRSAKDLKKEIDGYMSDFKYFDDEGTYGYRKGDLFIQEYIVIDEGLYRKIIITY